MTTVRMIVAFGLAFAAYVECPSYHSVRVDRARLLIEAFRPLAGFAGVPPEIVSSLERWHAYGLLLDLPDLSATERRLIESAREEHAINVADLMVASFSQPRPTPGEQTEVSQ